jgi:hypothetical protein
LKPPISQTRIVERLDQPLGDRMAEMNLMSVFEIEQDFAHHTAAAIGRDRGGEVQKTVSAIGARERFRDRALERFRAGHAEGWLDARRLLLASGAEIIVVTDRLRANRAERRIKQRGYRSQRFKFCFPHL